MKRFLLSIMMISLFLTACNQKVPTWQEQYDLGVRYLSDGNYEEAIIAFTAAIDIDPMKVDTYLRLADVYVSRGNSVAARELLANGFDLTGDSRLSDAMAKLGIYQINIINETPQQGVLKLYRTKAGEDGWMENSDEVPSGGYISSGDAMVSFEVSGIQAGYRIGKLLINGEDWTSSLIYGGYGIFGMDISQFDSDLEIRFAMEENAVSLPTVTGVHIQERREDNIGRVLYAYIDPDTLDNTECNYTWEYRAHDSEVWSEVYFWHNSFRCAITPFNSMQDIDLAGKYVRVTASGKPNYSEGSITSSEFYVTP